MKDMGEAPAKKSFYRFIVLVHAGALAIAMSSAAPAHAGSAQRWVGASNVLLREANRYDAPVIGRLSLNAAVQLLSEPDGSGYCEGLAVGVRRGFMHCRYLALAPAKQETKNGLMGERPAPMLDWLEFKEQAAKGVGDQGRLENFSYELARTIGVASLAEWAGAGTFPKTFAIGLISALEFSTVHPSFFRDETQLSSRESVEVLSGKFGIPYRRSHLIYKREQQISLASKGDPATDSIESETVELAQPLQLVRLFRDGRLATESQRPRSEWAQADEIYDGECAGWTPGFALGDAEDRNWKYVIDSGRSTGRSDNPNPRNSLYAFHTTLTLPRAKAGRTLSSVKLDQERTGFVGGTYLYYDLDGDGIADLAVWEGQGLSGHPVLDSTTPDHRWYRLVLVNINGAWKILGSDSFNYGCGC